MKAVYSEPTLADLPLQGLANSRCTRAHCDCTEAGPRETHASRMTDRPIDARSPNNSASGINCSSDLPCAT